MSMIGAVVGIDPSGRRLALVARGAGLARSTPPAAISLRADREQARFEEAEGALREYVARHGLSGSRARLCVPASRVFTARLEFPPLKDRDLRAALAIEMERLFPVPASRLVFGWRRGRKEARGQAGPLVVAAVPADYLERWQEAASRAGLTLASAIPSAWALASALAEIGGAEAGGIAAVLRDAGGDVECALLSGGNPFFSAVRSASERSAPAEGIHAAASGLLDAPGDSAAAPLALFAPDRWMDTAKAAGEALGLAVRAETGFEARAAQAALGAGGGEVFDLLGAFGAAARGDAIDLLARGGEGFGSRAARWVAAGAALLALAFGAAWPAIVAGKTRAEAARLADQIAAIRPAVAWVEEAMADLDDVEERIAVLRAAAEGREGMLLALRDLTDRLPQGTWLTGLRLENRKVEIDGLSAAANEIFPLLARDGRFRKVEFASPITRQPDNIERFQVRAEYAPAGEPQGGAR